MKLSPWISNLDSKIDVSAVDGNLRSDVVIIGAGISGVITAYNLLISTNKKVILLDSNRCGFGATGHNAGMMVTFVENIDDISVVGKYSKEVITDTLKLLEGSWSEFHKIRELIPGINEYFTEVEGTSGYEDIDSLSDNLSKFQSMRRYGMDLKEVFYISDQVKINNFSKELNIVSQTKIDKLFPSSSVKFIGYSIMPNLGVITSAQLVQDILEYLLSNYSHRFKVFENSSVSDIVNLPNSNICIVNNYHVEAKNIIVCTNGFKVPNIVGVSDFDKVNILGVVNQMMGKYVQDDVKPTAYSYYKKQVGVEGDIDYVYGTARKMKNKTLMTFGNSRDDIIMDNKYDSEASIKKEVVDELKSTAKKYFDSFDSNKPDFLWHGLMGYTNSRSRMVDEFPKSSGILYNLGCNGVGIMPAIASGKLIAEFFTQGKIRKTFWEI